MNHPWHHLSTDQVVHELSSSPTGLTREEAALRLEKYGENILPESKPTPIWLIFLRQFQSPLIYVLFAAAGVIYWLHGLSDAVTIGVVLLINALIGSIQEGRAQNTLHALRTFLETKSVVVRDGEKAIIADRSLVVGDVIYLQEGEKVPADARILQSHNLLLSEAALTGESTPVHKIGDSLPEETVLADQKNMVFKGTLVLGGNATAMVVATGVATHIGAISASLTKNQGEIPLKKEIDYLSGVIIRTVAGVCVLLTILGLSKGYSLSDMISTAVSLAVSVIPEGLPVVLTLILSTGVWRMSKRNALVKKLQAVEGLGQVDIIAVDKTGTITKNQMTMVSVFLRGKFYRVTGAGYEPTGSIELHGKPIDPAHHHDLQRAGIIAAHCASAYLSRNETTHSWQVTGDPTEAALLVFAKKAGIDKQTLLQHSPVLEELPFDYRTKLRATLSVHGTSQLLSVTGAPEAIIDACNLNISDRAVVEEAVRELSEQGLRVVGFAFKEGELHHIKHHISHLNFGGLYAMQDPLHAEVPSTIASVSQAGIRVVLITGDHIATARSIAQAAGIYHEGDSIISGKELSTMSEQELKEKLATVSVFCRVSPEQKMLIIRAYQAIGKRIAMTGDGVNDAPSLVAADLGISMGQVGTEVAKEASDIILLDDNFKSIVAAIEEGRAIYATIRKAITYLFTTSIAEIVAITGSIILGLPLLFTAAQIIWLNFVTDGFLTAALAMEPHDENMLKQGERRRIVDRRMTSKIVWIGTLMAVGSLATFALSLGEGVEKASTVALTALAAVQWVYAWNVRTPTTIFDTRTKRNHSYYLAAATLIVVLLQVAAVHVPLFQRFLNTTSLSVHEWLYALIPAVCIYLIEEVRKHIARRREG